ncbi:MAG: hypothetical protein JNK82_36570 [Myxococcaceae bacterium]|nr:hypothetical protein [Myxococcaceae bacterium]
MKILAGIVLVALLGWLGGTYYVASHGKAAHEARRKQHIDIAAAGEKAATELRALYFPSLKEACADKLPKGPPESVVGYTLKLGDGERTGLDGYKKRLDGVAVRMNDRGEYLGEDELPEPERPLNLTYSMSPDDWSRYLGDDERSQQRTAAVKVVVLTVYRNLRAPSISLMGDTFSAGDGEYASRVVAWPSGEKLCEGTGKVRMTLPKVTGHGGSAGDAAADSRRKLSDDWVEATLASPLDDVCEAGGRALCTVTGYELRPADW